MHFIDDEGREVCCPIVVVPPLFNQGVHQVDDRRVEKRDFVLRQQGHEGVAELEAELIEALSEVVPTDFQFLHLFSCLVGVENLDTDRA